MISKTEPLGYEHKELLHDRMKNIRTRVSEYSFPNLYLFRAAHSYEVIFDGDIYIKGRSYDGFNYLMPTKEIRSSE